MNLIELYDIYGKLLTDKQRNTFELYYLKDLSLREIAQNLKISFQAVNSSLEISRKQLFHFEEVVNMKAYKEKINEVFETLNKNGDTKVLKIINKIK